MNSNLTIMKNILILFAIGAFTLLGCKKDKSAVPVVLPTYVEIDREYIADNDTKLADIDILVSKNDVAELKDEAVILFKSHLGNYGKLQIVDVYKADPTDSYFTIIKFNLTVYNPDGSILASKQEQVLSMSSSVDLNDGELGSGQLKFDTSDNINCYLFSLGDTRLYLYSN